MDLPRKKEALFSILYHDHRVWTTYIKHQVFEVLSNFLLDRQKLNAIIMYEVLGLWSKKGYSSYFYITESQLHATHTDSEQQALAASKSGSSIEGKRVHLSDLNQHGYRTPSQTLVLINLRLQNPLLHNSLPVNIVEYSEL